MDFDLDSPDDVVTLGAGEFFGEIGALNGWPQSVTVKALTALRGRADPRACVTPAQAAVECLQEEDRCRLPRACAAAAPARMSGLQ